jgi:hypothetical protein
MTLLRVPLERLPSSPAERHAALRDYFCDKDAEAQADGSAWNLTLTWPNDDERHVDPRLDEGLAWWGQGITRRTMVRARRRSGRVLSALYDTWTLHSWSEWLTTRRGESEDIVVLHVDDHRDLGAPRLFIEAGGWQDAIANAPWTLNDPGAVEAAIQSGALGMGSFLTPFLHRFPDAEVRHLCQPPKATATRDFRIARTTVADDLLDPGRLRPAIDLKPVAGATGLGCYRLTPDVSAWLDMVGSGPVLLHIDMDYFNNRFDGDSDWRKRSEPFDPPLDHVLGKIDEMAEALRRTGVGARLEDVVIAYSPGFFPAEFWSAAEARLRPALERLYEP